MNSPLPGSARRLSSFLVLAVIALSSWTPVLDLANSARAAGNPPVIISPTMASIEVNRSFNYQIVLANFESGTYAAEGLAPGLVLDPRVGSISGAPTALGTYAIQLMATTSNGTATSKLTLSVLPDAPPVITAAPSVTVIRGVPLTYQIVASNAPTHYQVDGLPDGLSLDTATGLISGTPTMASDYSLLLLATNVRGDGSAPVELHVVNEVPVVTLTAETATANPVHGDVGTFLLTRIGQDFSQPLTVVFTVKGTARNGVDYKYLSLSKTIKAGKGVKRVHVNAYNSPGSVAGAKRTVKLTVQPSDAYTLGDIAEAKVKIFYDP